MEASLPTYPETREDICAALRKLEASDVDETAPLYQLQYQLATTSYAKAMKATAQSTPCKYASEIAKVYAAMDANLTNADHQYFQLYTLGRLCEHKDSNDSVMYIAQTGLERIFRAMALSNPGCSIGCNILSQMLRIGAICPFTNGAARAILNALANVAPVCRDTWNIAYVGMSFLHTVVISSPANAAQLAKEPDVASIVIAAKHLFQDIATARPFMVDKCNAILKCL